MRRGAPIAGVAVILLTLLAATTPASATFAGPDGRIAFSDSFTGQIYSVRPDGTGLRRLTHTPDGTRNLSPDWSPDGSRVAFSSDLHGPWRIYEVNSDGTHRHVVAGELNGFHDFTPAYTPDGSAFVFDRCFPDFRRCEIWMMNVDGTHRHALTRVANGTFDERPDVAPDGRHIAFSRHNSNGVVARIFLMGIGGERAHAITRAAIEADAPSFSPDGRRLTFATNSNRPWSATYSIQTDGTGLRRLSQPRFPHNDFNPSYSPSGTMIAFSSDRRYADQCCQDLFVMSADGSGLRRLDLHLRGPYDNDWGPSN